MGIDSRNSETTLSLDAVRSKVSDLDIFKYYCSPFKDIGKKFCSELRRDPIPSAIISPVKGVLRYKDFGHMDHAFDSVGYVQYKYNLPFMEALNVINNDFSLGLGSKTRAPFTQQKQGITSGALKVRPKVETIIQIKRRPYNYLDRLYWDQYQISIETLTEFRVHPITHYWVNDNRFHAHEVCYAYCEHKTRFKIYSPLKYHGKWYGNMKPSDVQGYSGLPIMGKEVLLVSSLKDVMCLYELGIPAVALQGEGFMPKRKLIELLQRKFERIRVLYDNDFDKKDNPGQEMARRICKEYGLENICIPESYQTKDPSDLVFAHGPIPLVKLIKSW